MNSREEILREKYEPRKFTREEILSMEPERHKFSDQEESYRRGYSQGFSAARRNPDINEREIIEWRNGIDETAPPGSGLDGQYLHGLLEDETHRFFVNRLEKPTISK